MVQKTKKKLLLGSILAGLALMAAIAFYPQHGSSAEAGSKDKDKHAEAAPAGGPPPAVPVEAVLVQYEPVQIWNDYSGRLQAVDFVEVRPQVGGPIIEVKFKDGQIVNKGDVLFIIDPRPYKATLDQAQADFQKTKNEQILAQKDLKRAQELIKSQTIAERLLDERQSNASVAKSSVDSAQAQVNQAKLNLEYTNVVAPISGRTSRAEQTVGNLVQIGQPVLTTIVSNEGIYADFEVDEKTYMHLIQSTPQDNIENDPEAIPVKLTVGRDKDSDSEILEGTIESFDNQIDTSSGTIRARALFSNQEGKLLPGMFVNVSIASPTDEEQILVSSEAIGTDQDRKFVYVVGDGNKVVYREITLGGPANGKRIISSGLKPGEKVITSGVMKLRPEMIVEPKIQTTAVTQMPKKVAEDEQPKPLIEP